MEKMKVPLLGASNFEDVEVTWETRVLDDGYVVQEMIEFNIITHYEPQ
jgi:hypothetical protein